MERKGKLVLASGVFDLIHPGHLSFLEKAKEAGGSGAQLLVVVARDSTVEMLKGSKPVIPEEQRRLLVESLKPVDKAVLGSEKFDMAGIIERYRPDIVAVGYDQNLIEAEVKRIVSERGFPVKIVKIGKFGPKGLDSSSKIKRLIARISRELEG
ncbi:MAG: adenylyltransferase/cytidyltransferase family protein [Candidatus Hecatellaceae archaeon]|nr:MAG: FAD synthase [Candidatus Hecatellales archaeon]